MFISHYNLYKMCLAYVHTPKFLKNISNIMHQMVKTIEYEGDDLFM